MINILKKKVYICKKKFCFFLTPRSGFARIYTYNQIKCKYRNQFSRLFAENGILFREIILILSTNQQLITEHINLHRKSTLSQHPLNFFKEQPIKIVPMQKQNSRVNGTRWRTVAILRFKILIGTLKVRSRNHAGNAVREKVLSVVD